MIRLKLIEDETSELKNQSNVEMGKLANLQQKSDLNEREKEKKINDDTERQNDIKNYVRDNLSKIIDIQLKVKNLTEKSENVVDWGDQVRNLQTNQKKLLENSNKYSEKHEKDFEDIRNDLKSRDANLTSEIDKYYSQINEDFEKLKDELGMKTNIGKNMSKIKNRYNNELAHTNESSN